MITGSDVRAARERAGLTQEQLGERLGVAQRTVGNWERAKTLPRNRAAAIERFIAEQEHSRDSTPALHDVSDVELLAEIARRFERGRAIGAHVTVQGPRPQDMR